jgi:hypothetical protein
MYHSLDKVQGKLVEGAAQDQLWTIKSSDCNDSLGKLDLFKGMKVMITENIAISKSLVNRAKGTVRKIVYDIDVHGQHFANTCYVQVPGSLISLASEDEDVAAIFPTTTSFSCKAGNQSI